MSRHIIVVAAIAMLIAYAYDDTRSDEPSTDIELSGNFSVSSAGNSAILLDTSTGKSWLLHQSESDRIPSAWLPLQRLDSDDDVAEWHSQQENFSDSQAKRSRLTEELISAQEQYETAQNLTIDKNKLRVLRERVSKLEARLNPVQ